MQAAYERNSGRAGRERETHNFDALDKQERWFLVSNYCARKFVERARTLILSGSS
jgi:hypothetical protein